VNKIQQRVIPSIPGIIQSLTIRFQVSLITVATLKV